MSIQDEFELAKQQIAKESAEKHEALRQERIKEIKEFEALKAEIKSRSKKKC